MIKRIDHVSFAVRDLERARAFFVDRLGGRELFSAPLPPMNFRWTTIELGSSCVLELVDPLEGDGFLRRFLDTRGEGVHHVTLHVDDAKRTQTELEARGVPTFGYSEALPGWKEVFVHPKHAFGVLLQFAEFDPLDWIEPQGYVPRAYAEFAPARRVGAADDPVEVRRRPAAGGDEIEIRRGDAAVTVPATRARELLEALRAAVGEDGTE